MNWVAVKASHPTVAERKLPKTRKGAHEEVFSGVFNVRGVLLGELYSNIYAVCIHMLGSLQEDCTLRKRVNHKKN